MYIVLGRNIGPTREHDRLKTPRTNLNYKFKLISRGSNSVFKSIDFFFCDIRCETILKYELLIYRNFD